eukprot:3671413-Heterocapsa_arctica.AAC.1
MLVALSSWHGAASLASRPSWSTASEHACWLDAMADSAPASLSENTRRMCRGRTEPEGSKLCKT